MPSPAPLPLPVLGEPPQDWRLFSSATPVFPTGSLQWPQTRASSLPRVKDAFSSCRNGTPNRAARFAKSMRVASFIVCAFAVAISLVAVQAEPPPPIQQAIMAEQQGAPPGGRIVVAGLFDWIFGGPQPGEPSRSAPGPQPRGSVDEEENRPKRRVPQSSGGTYRTLCVRLCDGFPIPISFATTKDRLSLDAGRCEQQCPSRSRLFVYHNPGQSLEDMTDLKGNPYRDLPQAFRYQTAHVADCTCRGNPWDAEALARHQAYARAPAPKDNGVKSAEQSRAGEPQRRGLQSSRGYRDRRAMQDDD
jgi:hypothetical protein